MLKTCQSILHTKSIFLLVHVMYTNLAISMFSLVCWIYLAVHVAATVTFLSDLSVSSIDYMNAQTNLNLVISNLLCSFICGSCLLLKVASYMFYFISYYFLLSDLVCILNIPPSPFAERCISILLYVRMWNCSKILTCNVMWTDNTVQWVCHTF